MDTATPNPTAGRGVLKKIVGVLQWIAASSVGILVLVLLARYAFASEAIVLTTVVLPESLRTSAVSSSELTYRLRDHIDSVKRTARPSLGQLRSTIGEDVAAPDVQVPLAGISLPKFLSLLDDVTGRDRFRVRWEVSARPGAGATKTWLVTAHMPDRPAIQTVFDPANPEPALSVIARGIVGEIEPLILARAMLYDGHCVGARGVAQRHLSREAVSPKTVSAAMNFLGLTTECQDSLLRVKESRAERYYLASIALDPTNGLARANLGRLLAKRLANLPEDEAERQRVLRDSMRAEFRLALKHSGTHPGVHEAWGWALQTTGSPDSAIVHLTHAIEREPRLASAYVTRADAYTSLGKEAKALDDYMAAIARSARDIRTLKAYGHELLRIGDYVGASGAFTQASTLDPGDHDTQYYIACALQRTDSAAADSVFREVRTHFKPTRGYYKQADAALTTGRMADC